MTTTSHAQQMAKPTKTQRTLQIPRIVRRRRSSNPLSGTRMCLTLSKRNDSFPPSRERDQGSSAGRRAIAHLSLMSSIRWPPKGRKPPGWAPLGDAGAEAWPLPLCSECLRLRLLSRPPRLSPAVPTLARRRSLRALGGSWVSSSPSSWRRVIWVGRRTVEVRHTLQAASQTDSHGHRRNEER